MANPNPKFLRLLFWWSVIIVGFLLKVSCERENDDPLIPVLYTGEIIEIDSTGSVFTGLFRNMESDRVTHYGFIWSLEETPTLDNSLKYSLPLPFETEAHSYRNSSSLIKNVTYYMRVFVTYDNSSTFYGKTISFYSLGSSPPLINNVIPLIACFTDTVMIKGSNFGPDSTGKRVFFGEDQARILSANDSSIKVQVPFFTSSNSYFSTESITIKVLREGYPTAQTDLFHLSPPRITSHTPKEGKSFTEITVFGSGFHPLLTELTVGKYQCEIQLIQDKYVQALLPPLFEDTEDSLRIKIGNASRTIGTIKVLAPFINRIHPDTVFSYEELKLYGKNLDIEKLSIEINEKSALILSASDDSLTVQIPGEICSDELRLKMQLGDENQLCNESAAFKQPRNIHVRTTENQLYDGVIDIDGDYFPDLKRLQSVQLNQSESEYSYNFGINGSSLSINIPPDVQPDNEWLSTNINFCQSTQLSYDSVFHVPPPKILDGCDTIYNYTSHEITGENFNAFSHQNVVFIGETYIQNRSSTSQDKLLLYTPNGMDEGTYPLKIITNGQESEPVNIDLVHRFKELADLPEIMGKGSMFFLHKNVLFMGGGQWSESNNFYSFDLATHEWKIKSQLPVKTGLYFSDSFYGYAYGDGKLFRYDFDSDIWSLISQKEIQYSSGFLHENKIFILPIGVNQTHHYYDLETGTWKEFSGYTGSVRSRWRMPCVLGDGVAYLFHEWDIFVLDLSNYSITDSNGSQDPEDDKSLVGFEYGGEAYLYDSNHFEIYNTQDFSYRQINGPIVPYPNLIRDGTEVYLYGKDKLWTFDLTCND